LAAVSPVVITDSAFNISAEFDRTASLVFTEMTPARGNSFSKQRRLKEPRRHFERARYSAVESATPTANVPAID